MSPPGFQPPGMLRRSGQGLDDGGGAAGRVPPVIGVMPMISNTPIIGAMRA